MPLGNGFQNLSILAQKHTHTPRHALSLTPSQPLRSNPHMPHLTHIHTITHTSSHTHHHTCTSSHTPSHMPHTCTPSHLTHRHTCTSSHTQYLRISLRIRKTPSSNHPAVSSLSASPHLTHRSCSCCSHQLKTQIPLPPLTMLMSTPSGAPSQMTHPPWFPGVRT